MSKSKDIRSFFSISPKVGGSKQASKTNGVNDPKKKKRRIIESDSDEEPTTPTPKKLKPSDDKKKKEEKSKYFAASAADVFGNDPVKRVSRSPAKLSKTKKDDLKIEDHDDAEFEAALLQLDTDVEWTKASSKDKNKVNEGSSPTKASDSRPQIADHSKSAEGSGKSKSAKSSPEKSDATISDFDSSSKRKEEKISVKDSPKKPTSPFKKETPDKKPADAFNSRKLQTSNSSPEKKESVNLQSSPKKPQSKVNEEPEPKKIKREEPKENKSGSSKSNDSPSKSKTTPASAPIVPGSDLLWVEKYKPTTIKQIVGQQGEKSCVAKLLRWLKNWTSNQSGTKKLVRPSPWAKDDDGAYFKAALLSGRPGIGKTTTAHLVCKELGYDIVEFNASDTRSKRLLHEEVTELLSTKSLNPYFSGGNAVTSRHCLLMDEVDGMAGNEDRGGMQELIALIKSSKVPIICMCNDRSHPKIRSLLNYCFDLSFARPRIEQLRGALMSICFKEKLKIPKDVLDNIITNCEQDIRLILNHLSMLAANQKTDIVALQKHVKLGPWDVLRKVFSAEDHKTMSIHDKSDLFFHDYSIAPLFVYENYLGVEPRVPHSAKKSKRMALFAEAAESLSRGDLTDKVLRSTNSWSLLPTQAMFSSVIPGTILEGYVSQRINFPAWLGKNSRRNKLDRQLQEVQQHTRLKVSGSKQAINLDYLVPLRELILRPLITKGSDGVHETLEVLKNYDLVKDDLESILELSQWPNKKDPMSLIESKVKAALTRAYNKAGPACPYAIPGVKKGSKRGNNDENADLEGEAEADEDDDSEEKDDVTGDGMIVVKKPAAKKGGPEKASTSKADSGRSKARGGGSSRGGRGQSKRGKK